MPPETRTSHSEAIINFLKSADFTEILNNAIEKKTEVLLNKIEELQSEVVNLRESNIEMVYLLTNKRSHNELSIVNNNSNNNPADASNGKNKDLKKDLKKNNISVINQSNKKIAEKETLEKTIIKQNELDKGDHTLNDNFTEWEFPKRRRNVRRTRAIYGKALDETSFKGVAKYIDYHVYRLPPEFNEENVITYLKSKNVTDIKCQKMTSRYPNEYSSFKISVSLREDRIFRNPNIWPEFCVINRFLPKILDRNRKESKQNT